MTAMLVSLLSSALTFAILAVQIAVAIVAGTRWASLRPNARRAFVIALVAVGLTLPSNLITAMHLSFGAVAPDLPDVMADIIGVFTRVAILGGIVVQVVFVTMNTLVATTFAERHPFPWLFGRERPAPVLAYALLVGVACGVGSTLLFRALGVEEGELIRLAEKLIPGVDMRAPSFVLGVSLPALLGMAVAEEILFRGIVQGWLVKRFPATVAGSWGAIVLVSLAWALCHVANANDVALKLGQILLLGLLFGWLARRWSVEASAAAHLGLNLGVVVMLVVIGA